MPPRTYGARTRTTAPSLLMLQRLQEQGYEEQTMAFLSMDGGFLPRCPLSVLPDSHQLWETIGASLPSMCLSRDYTSIMSMPELSAEAEDLPDKHVLRANALLGAMAHALKNMSLGDTDIPQCVLRPWTRLGERMDRPTTSFNSLDWFVYNFDYVPERCCEGPEQGGQVEITNSWAQLKPAVMACGGMGEYNFIISCHMIERSAARLPGVVARAQQAILSNNPDALRVELLNLLTIVERMTKAFLGSSPSPMSSNYVDQVTWGQVIGRCGSPVVAKEKTISGLLFPSIHLLDAFLGRDPGNDYKSDMGVLASTDLKWLPKLHRDFFEAVRAVSLLSYIKVTDGHEFHNMFREVHGLFVGKEGTFGFLEVHRLKIIGFIEVATKTGRSKTAAGTKLDVGWQSRPWLMVNRFMLDAMAERQRMVVGSRTFTSVQVKRVAALPGTDAKMLTFNMKGTGLLFHPGDRLSVLPSNSDDLVDETLDALGEDGALLIPLTNEWEQACRERQVVSVKNGGGNEFLPLYEFLKHATLHPMTRDVAEATMKAMYCTSTFVTRNYHRLQQTDFATFVSLVLATSHVSPGHALLQQLASTLPPLRRREYSIASAPNPPTAPEELSIVVGRVRYGITGPAWIFDSSSYTERISKPDAISSSSSQDVEEVKSSRVSLVSRTASHLDSDLLEGTAENILHAEKDEGFKKPLSRMRKFKLPKPQRCCSQLVLTDNLTTDYSTVLPAKRAVSVGTMQNVDPSIYLNFSFRVNDNELSPEETWNDSEKAVLEKYCALMRKPSRGGRFARARRWLVELTRVIQAMKGVIGPPHRAWKCLGAPKGIGDLTGTASNLLLDRAAPGLRLPTAISPAPTFRLPEDPTVPVVMVSLGTGVAPFMGFLQEIAAQSERLNIRREVWLVWGIQSRENLYFQDAWMPHVKSGLVTLKVAFSREDVDLVVDEGAGSETEMKVLEGTPGDCGREEEFGLGERKIRFVDGQRKRINNLFDRNTKVGQENLHGLWNLLEMGGHMYVCGVPILAEVTRKITSEAYQLCAQPLYNISWYFLQQNLRKLGDCYAARLIAQDRLCIDLFNSGHPPVTDMEYSWSEVASHHTSESCWIVFRGGVYDITKYLTVHPGGYKLLLDKGGRDATLAFEQAHGRGNFRVASLLDGFYIGKNTVRIFVIVLICI
ncbi:unnamed protein product [Choristocarpus tenellus]